MAAASPRVSVGIPVYNGEKYVSAAIESIREQDLSDIEIIISDNGSTDATDQICREAAEKDDRIRYVRSPVNRGGGWNFGNVLDLATAPLFKWCAADDIARPDFVRRCVEALDQGGPGVVVAFPRTQLIDATGDVFDELGDRTLLVDQPTASERIHTILRAEASHIVYGVIRTDVLRSTRGMMSMVGDDMVLLTELACRGTFALVPEQSFLQRRHPEQFSALGQGQVGWHDPSGGSRFVFPQTKLNRELYRAVAIAPLPWPEKLRCWRSIAAGWTIPKKRAVASDIRHVLGIPWPLTAMKSRGWSGGA